MQDELEDNQEDYLYLTHAYWCDLLSTIEVKDIRKRAATKIKKIDSSRAASNYDSDGYVSTQSKKKEWTGILCNNKGTNNKAPKHHATHQNCVLCKKAGIPDIKYMPHSSEECFGKSSNQKNIKYGLG